MPLENLPWLAAAAVAVLITYGLLAWLRRHRTQPLPLPTEWLLTARPVFSIDERRVYRQLREALPHHIVLSKLPLVRFCQPTDPQRTRYWYQLLGATHVGFAICSSNGRVLAAIDIENDTPLTRRKTQIKQKVLSACRVRYVRCAVDQLPSIAELQLLVPQSTASPSVQTAAGVTMPPQPQGPGVRRDAPALWQDSDILQDSFFGTHGRADAGLTSGFGALVRGLPPNDAGARVAEGERRPVRH